MLPFTWTLLRRYNSGEVGMMKENGVDVHNLIAID